jgi:hypothetical protein
MAVFTLSETKEAIKKLYPLRIPILLNGATGVGKTSTVREVSKELGLPLIEIRLSMERLEYVVGIPVTPDKKDDDVDFFDTALYEDYFPAFESGAVIFFDDFYPSELWHSSVVKSVSLDRTLGRVRLHPATFVIGAVSIGEDLKDANVLDEDLLATFAIINVVPSTDEISNYLSEERSDSSSIESHDIIDEMFEEIEILSKSYDVNRIKQLEPTFTPRNYEFAVKVIDAYYNDPFLRKLLYTVIPQDVADMLLTTPYFLKIRPT